MRFCTLPRTLRVLWECLESDGVGEPDQLQSHAPHNAHGLQKNPDMHHSGKLSRHKVLRDQARSSASKVEGGA